LGVWLHRRRQDAAAGTLSPAYVALNVIPAWEVVRTLKADNEARWNGRLAELEKYLATGSDWPRHKGFATEEERVLGVWLHVQRISRREGTLTQAREAQMNEQLPGWREGRSRSGGRRRNGPLIKGPHGQPPIGPQR
jgi:hypothetical protein